MNDCNYAGCDTDVFYPVYIMCMYHVQDKYTAGQHDIRLGVLSKRATVRHFANMTVCHVIHKVRMLYSTVELCRF